MRKFILIILWMGCLSLNSMADSFLKDVKLQARIGYNLGGTAPIGLPATVRSLESYKLHNNVTIELDGHKTIDGKWGALVGLRAENKDMDVDAKVKNYHMEMIRGGESLKGVFTGYVQTQVRQWMITLPIQATYDVNDRIQLRMGPYMSYLLSKDFEGSVYDGHLRVGDPTGPRIEMGSDPGTRGIYDFSDHMRRFQVGISAGIDCHIYRRFGLYADLNWGLNGIFKRSFKTIEQTLYPVYGTFGVIYRISNH